MVRSAGRSTMLQNAAGDANWTVFSSPGHAFEALLCDIWGRGGGEVSSIINLKSVAEISFAQSYEAAYTLPQVVYGG